MDQNVEDAIVASMNGQVYEYTGSDQIRKPI